MAASPSNPEMIGKDFGASFWQQQASAADEAYVSVVHPRFPDNRMATDIVGAVRAPDRTIAGYIGVSVLVERIGRRLSTIEVADQSICQVVDQTGRALFTNDLKPNGIACVDPTSRKFLQANDAFAQMARRFGGLPPCDITEAAYDDVKIAPADAIEKVLSFGTPFQLIEHPFKGEGGMTHFVNVNLLRLQGSHQTIQGVLYLVEDKTRDVTLRHELIDANAAKDQFLALLSHELRNPLTPVIAMVGELEANTPESPQVRQALEVIRRTVQLQARLIDHFLDPTPTSKGKSHLTFEVVSAHEILRRAYEICREDIALKTIETIFQLRAGEIYVE